MSQHQILHSIQASLYKNPLTETPGDFVARVSSDRTLSLRDICLSATTRGSADVSAATMEHVVELFHNELRYLLCDGFSVNTGAYLAAPHIRGVFTSPDDTFDPTRHTLLFELQQGVDLRTALDSVEVVVNGVATVAARITSVFDVASGTTSELLTTGNNLRVRGREIKITGDDDHPEVGLYFVSQDEATFGARLKVDPSAIVVNKPSEIIFVNPPFDAGAYKLEVVTQYSNAPRLLKEPRTLVLNKALTVTA
jgi:hypothetical protein